MPNDCWQQGIFLLCSALVVPVLGAEKFDVANIAGNAGEGHSI